MAQISIPIRDFPNLDRLTAGSEVEISAFGKLAFRTLEQNGEAVFDIELFNAEPVKRKRSFSDVALSSMNAALRELNSKTQVGQQNP